MPQQRDIIIVPFELPQGVEYHPVIIISNDAVHEIEGVYYAVMCSGEVKPEEFAVELTPEMIVGKNPMRKRSYIKTHLIQTFTERELRTHVGSVTLDAFHIIKHRIVESIFEAQ